MDHRRFRPCCGAHYTETCRPSCYTRKPVGDADSVPGKLPASPTEKLRFSLDEASNAWDGKFNCGPGALCAALNLTPDELRPHMGDFFSKGYTNPTLMFETLDRLHADYRRVYRGDEPIPLSKFPELKCGLVRIQFGGPWTKPGVPMRARYRQTHWVAVRKTGILPVSDGCASSPLESAARDGRLPSQAGSMTSIFDINAMCAGGWIGIAEWALRLIPWLIKECYPKADGTWWPTHAIEIESFNPSALSV